jgi:hypothetical protein
MLFTWQAGHLLQIIIHRYPIFSHSGLELSIAMFRLPEGKPDIAQPSFFIFAYGYTLSMRFDLY